MKRVLIILILSLIPCLSEATTFYVGKSIGGASNSNACTSPSAPCLTIQGGLAKVGYSAGAGAGHEVVVLDSTAQTYTESFNFTSFPSGSSGKNFVLRAASYTVGAGRSRGDGSVASSVNIITIQHANPSAGSHILSVATYTTIRGFRIRGQGGNNTLIHGDYGVFGVIIEDNELDGGVNPASFAPIVDPGPQGIFTREGTWTIRRNYIHNIGYSTAKDHCLYMGSANNLFEANEISFCADIGIHQYVGSGATVTGNTIRDNYIHDMAGWAYLTADGSTNSVYNNIAANVGGGFYQYINGNNTSFYNNTCYNATYGCILTDSSTSGAIARNNLAPGQTINGPMTASNNITAGLASSHFVSAAAQNFKLLSTSPARNQGISLAAYFTTDIAGSNRGAAPWDVGAYEFAATVTTTVAITSPSSTGSFTNPVGSSTVSLAGTATNATAISWVCYRCGTSGGAGGTLTNWTANVTGLKAGVNQIIVQADPGAVTATIDVTFPPSFPGNTLAGAWAFDAANSSADSSGNGNNGTFIDGATTTTAGKFGGALQLDGVNDYFRVADANSLDFTQSFTYSMWVFPEVISTSFATLLSKDSTVTGYVQFLYATSSGYCGSGALLGGFPSNGSSGPSFTACKTPPPLPINQWSHIALTYNGPGPESSLILYVDGVAVTTTSASGYMEPSTGVLRFGQSSLDNEPFKGRIDEVRAYNWAIPVTDSGKLNTSPNLPCGFTTQADRTNMAKVSVIGDMNCPIIQGTPPLLIKIPATASGVKLSGTVKFGSQP